MARDGDGIYESDAGFDALSDIADDVMREAVYWFAPEQVEQDVHWLNQALNVIEMLLILAEDKWGYRFVEKGATIRRWQAVFLVSGMLSGMISIRFHTVSLPIGLSSGP